MIHPGNFRLFIWILLACTAACAGDKKEAGDEQGVETLLPDMTSEVTVMELRLSDFNHELISNGKLSARRYVDLTFESAETIAGIYVRNGDRVAEGQKLAELAAFRLHNKTMQAKDALDRAKLDLQDVLIGQGYAIEDSAKAPEATLQLVRTKSGYSQALAQYELALYEEEHAVLKAPFDGVVANLFAKPLNTSSTSDVFCTVIDPRSLEASFTILESELALVKAGDKVEVTPFSVPDGKTEGRISEINPLVDANGMVKVKATIAYTGKLFEGMNVRISIQRLAGRQLAVPKEAVVLRSGRQVVFTLTGNKAYWNYVQTGLENAGHYTITEGLKEGDIVITSGNINLAHETVVDVTDK
ncbi:MAG: efflux RND transporter periplasmic adaptor subunit [Tannerellaceae bacterium]|nr:efflux RND transporter periplasmic adaptor subunit [Tannerellaceae bacterium]